MLLKLAGNILSGVQGKPSMGGDAPLEYAAGCTRDARKDVQREIDCPKGSHQRPAPENH